MRGIRNQTLRLFAAAVLVGTVFAGMSEASVITLTPSSQTIATSGTASVNVVLSGLGASETVGGFNLNFSFNNSILTGASFANDPGSKMGALPLDLSVGFSGGSLNLFFLADAAITQPALKTLEGTGFTLATLTFTGLSEGLSPVTLLSGDLSNFDGTALLQAPQLNSASICVDNPQTPGNPCGGGTTIPEPSTIILLSVGLAAIVALAGRRGRAFARM